MSGRALEKTGREFKWQSGGWLCESQLRYRYMGMLRTSPNEVQAT